MADLDVSWKQRFANYKKALTQLTKFTAKGSLNELEEQGLIQAFEYTHELGWNVLKDYLSYQGMASRTDKLSMTRALIYLRPST